MKKNAKFQFSVEELMGDEGGYVNDPVDAGGETNWGISKRSYPDIDIKKLTKDDAKEIYYRDFWEKYGYGAIPNSLLAAKVLSLSVNMGPKRAHILIQRAIRACGNPIKEDGILGPITLSHIKVNHFRILPALRSEAAGFYRELVARKVEQKKFINGWLARAYG